MGTVAEDRWNKYGIGVKRTYERIRMALRITNGVL